MYRTCNMMFPLHKHIMYGFFDADEFYTGSSRSPTSGSGRSAGNSEFVAPFVSVAPVPCSSLVVIFQKGLENPQKFHEIPC